MAIDWAGESTAAIEVMDYDRSLAWYRDVLGWNVVFELPAWKWAQLQSPVQGLLVGIGQGDLDQVIQSSGRDQRGVHRVGAAGRGDHEDAHVLGHAVQTLAQRGHQTRFLFEAAA